MNKHRISTPESVANAKPPRPVIFKKDEQKEVAFEVMEEAVVKIGKALSQANQTRITRKMIVALVHDDTGLAKGVIEKVLSSYEQLERTYLKGKL